VTDPCLLTAKKAAERLSVSVDWLLDQARAGKIRAVKLGRWRFTQADIDAYIHEQTDAQTQSRRKEAKRGEPVIAAREGRGTRRREPPKLLPMPRASRSVGNP